MEVNSQYFLIGGIVLFLVVVIILAKSFGRKKKEAGSLKGTRGLDVYSYDGHKIGKVKEAYLGDVKVYGYLVKLEKKLARRISKKSLLMNNKHVTSVKEIVLIDKQASRHFEDLPSEVAKE
ncbi:MAG: hypothetical protein ABIH92_01700 [Nanoarchaeota archaeon]